MNQLLALGKDVRKLKGEASDDEESSSESSEKEPPKRQKTSTPAPTSTPRREKGQKKTITMPDPVQMDVSQVDDDFIQRDAGASTRSLDCSKRYVCVCFFRSTGGRARAEAPGRRHERARQTHTRARGEGGCSCEGVCRCCDGNKHTVARHGKYLLSLIKVVSHKLTRLIASLCSFSLRVTVRR